MPIGIYAGNQKPVQITINSPVAGRHTPCYWAVGCGNLPATLPVRSGHPASAPAFCGCLIVEYSPEESSESPFASSPSPSRNDVRRPLPLHQRSRPRSPRSLARRRTPSPQTRSPDSRRADVSPRYHPHIALKVPFSNLCALHTAPQRNYFRRKSSNLGRQWPPNCHGKSRGRNVDLALNAVIGCHFQPLDSTTKRNKCSKKY